MKDYLRLRDLAFDFKARLDDVQCLYLDGVAGIASVHRQTLHDRSEMRKVIGHHHLVNDEMFDRTLTHYSMQVDGEDRLIPGGPRMTQAATLERTKRNGDSAYILAASCVVTLVAYWETFLRSELAKARGLGNVDSDLWADLTKLRNSICHRHDRVAADNVGKCGVVTWFKPGDKINIDFAQMMTIFLELRKECDRLELESMPPQTATIRFTYPDE